MTSEMRPFEEMVKEIVGCRIRAVRPKIGREFDTHLSHFVTAASDSGDLDCRPVMLDHLSDTPGVNLISGSRLASRSVHHPAARKIRPYFLGKRRRRERREESDDNAYPGHVNSFLEI